MYDEHLFVFRSESKFYGRKTVFVILSKAAGRDTRRSTDAFFIFREVPTTSTVLGNVYNT